MYIFTTHPSGLFSSFLTSLGREARGKAGCAWVTIFMGHFSFVCGVKTEPLCIDGGLWTSWLCALPLGPGNSENNGLLLPRTMIYCIFSTDL